MKLEKVMITLTASLMETYYNYTTRCYNEAVKNYMINENASLSILCNSLKRVKLFQGA